MLAVAGFVCALGFRLERKKSLREIMGFITRNREIASIVSPFFHETYWGIRVPNRRYNGDTIEVFYLKNYAQYLFVAAYPLVVFFISSAIFIQIHC